MVFRWNDWNLVHIAKHHVTTGEAEHVVANACEPFPLRQDNDALLVWGKTPAGRWLQVAFTFDPDDTVYVIHARWLTKRERQRITGC